MCAPCRAARAAYEKRRKIMGYSRVDGAGTYRRLRALAALGWPSEALGERLGITGAAVLDRTKSEANADRHTAARIRALYDELSMTPGPSRLTRSRAAAKGWAPPLAWDDDTIDDPKAKPYRETKHEQTQTYLSVDEIAVERVIAGEAIELTQAERAIAIERLARLGLTDRQIGDRIGVWGETVLRTRRRLGVESRWVA